MAAAAHLLCALLRAFSSPSVNVLHPPPPCLCLCPMPPYPTPPLRLSACRRLPLRTVATATASSLRLRGGVGQEALPQARACATEAELAMLPLDWQLCFKQACPNQTLRSAQAQHLAAISVRKDVVCIGATGAGKSAGYFLPACGGCCAKHWPRGQRSATARATRAGAAGCELVVPTQRARPPTARVGFEPPLC
jgi:hypothetical protein